MKDILKQEWKGIFIVDNEVEVHTWENNTIKVSTLNKALFEEYSEATHNFTLGISEEAMKVPLLGILEVLASTFEGEARINMELKQSFIGGTEEVAYEAREKAYIVAMKTVRQQIKQLTGK